MKQSDNSRIALLLRSLFADSVRSDRFVALDYLRGSVTALVVLHHSLLAYCRFGHFDRLHYLWSTAPIVDDSKWLGFDLIVLFNDGYFMPLMFLLSGLFVWPSLTRKGGIVFCRDRLLRLGLPFAIAVVTVIPLAYYPSFRMTGADIDFGQYWIRTMFTGPWPSGPAWFLGVLLAFDLVAALVLGFAPSASEPRDQSHPSKCFLWLVTLSVLFYFPFLALAGPTRWLSFGPFAVQTSRIGLYGVYFCAGIVVGRHGLRRFPVEGAQRYWTRWALLAILLFVSLVAMQDARLTGWLNLPPLGLAIFHASNFVLFCAVANVAAVAIALRFVSRSTALGESLAANAYGIYILHYPVVIWMQYALLDARLGAILKAVLVFCVAFCAAWGSTIALRRALGLARII